MNDNPLAQYFRRPAIHLELPSKGDYYAPGVLDMPESKEIPVFPMTAIDEITYKTPDALFNGSAIVDVIKSCIPAFNDPWQIPITDLTAILAAIRIASFGHIMDVETECPKCHEKAKYELDLRVILESIKYPDYSNVLEIGDLKITFKPMVYKDLNENNKLQFEEQKVTAIMKDGGGQMNEDQQIKMLSEAFKKVATYTIATLAKNIKTITTPESSCSDEAYILEFLRNCDNSIFKRIKKEVISQKASEALKPLQIKCTAIAESADGKKGNGKICGHEYEQPFTLDMTSFFAQDS